MPNRDYAARKKAKSNVNKWLILIIVFLLLAIAALALWGLKTATPSSPLPNVPTSNAQPKNTLPTPPEEVYSYIRDLENREVPVDKSSKLAQLTKEQEQLLQRQKEEEKRKQELLEQQQLAEQQAAQTQSKPENTTETVATVVEPPKVVALTPEELEAKKAKEQKLAEEKRKQAELKKQQEAKKAAEQAQKATEQAQKAKEAEKVVAKPATEAPKVVGKFGLQCGAFKNKAQAENMQARLAMAGYNARINSSGEWNRVVVGPVGDRAAASSAQSNARSVAECLIIGM